MEERCLLANNLLAESFDANRLIYFYGLLRHGVTVGGEELHSYFWKFGNEPHILPRAEA